MAAFHISFPAMPEPNPQSPQQYAVSIARWLLLLLPSVPMIFAPVIADAEVRSHGYVTSDDKIGAAIGSLVLTFCISTILSLVMGLLFEKWRHGTIGNFPRILGHAILILFANCFISFAGCAVFSTTH